VRLLVIGAGGHAKVVIDAARCAGMQVVGIVGHPGDPAEVLGVPVSADASAIEADGFIVAIGDNATRAAKFAECLALGMTPVRVIHPSAVLAEEITVHEGTFVAAGVIVNVHAHIGVNVILNTGCTVDHDCVVGDHSHIGPTASLCGGVDIGEGVLLGAGANVIPGVSVGSWSVVGAGAAVVSDLPPHTVCAGVPARPVHGIGD